MAYYLELDSKLVDNHFGIVLSSEHGELSQEKSGKGSQTQAAYLAAYWQTRTNVTISSYRIWPRFTRARQYEASLVAKISFGGHTMDNQQETSDHPPSQGESFPESAFGYDTLRYTVFLQALLEGYLEFEMQTGESVYEPLPAA